MRKIKVEEEKIDAVSDFVTILIGLNKDCSAFEGAIVCCYDLYDRDGLHVDVNLVSNNCGFTPMRDYLELDRVGKKTGFSVTVRNMLYFNHGEGSLLDEFIRVPEEILKSGIVVYDRNGNLTRLQEKYRADKRIEDESWRGAVEVEPPIQYKKTM